MIKIGDKAPDFTLFDKDGNAVTLSDFLGKKVVLYFYPKDNTPGCSRQACGFAAAKCVKENVLPREFDGKRAKEFMLSKGYEI